MNINSAGPLGGSAGSAPSDVLDGVFSEALIPALTSSVIPALIYQGDIFHIPGLTSSWGPNVILYCPRTHHLLVCHMLLPVSLTSFHPSSKLPCLESISVCLSSN